MISINNQFPVQYIFQTFSVYLVEKNQIHCRHYVTRLGIYTDFTLYFYFYHYYYCFYFVCPQKKFQCSARVVCLCVCLFVRARACVCVLWYTWTIYTYSTPSYTHPFTRAYIFNFTQTVKSRAHRLFNRLTLTGMLEIPERNFAQPNFDANQWVEHNNPWLICFVSIFAADDSDRQPPQRETRAKNFSAAETCFQHFFPPSLCSRPHAH